MPPNKHSFEHHERKWRVWFNSKSFGCKALLFAGMAYILKTKEVYRMPVKIGVITDEQMPCSSYIQRKNTQYKRIAFLPDILPKRSAAHCASTAAGLYSS